MATTFNTAFYNVHKTPPNLNTGWLIKVLDYRDMKTLVAILPDVVSWSFSIEVSDLGAGSVSVDMDSRFWHTYLANGLSTQTIKDHEYVFEMWRDGVRQFAWLGQNVDEEQVNDDGSKAVTISGPGIAETLKWAVIMRPGWPKKVPRIGWIPPVQGGSGKPVPEYRAYSSSDKLPAYLWQFPMKWPTMRMWYTVFKSAQGRGVIPFVSLMFNGVVDSAKRPFVYIKTIQNVVDKNGYRPEEPNQNLLDFLNDCTGQDNTKWFGQRLEWIMHPGFRLDVRRRIGVDRSKSVVFFEGNISNKSRKRARDGIFNRVVAVDVEGGESNAVDPQSVKDWNLREQRNETNKNVTDKTMRDELARIYLDQTKSEKSEWVVKVPYDDPGRIPFRNFFVGDTVGLSHIQPGSSSRLEAYRILAITLSMSGDSLVPEVELTLQNKFESLEKELERKITRLINKPNKLNLKDLLDVKVPDMPPTKAGFIWNPEPPPGHFELDPNYTGGDGSGGGVHVFVQHADPTTTPNTIVNPGDMWVQI